MATEKKMTKSERDRLDKEKVLEMLGFTHTPQYLDKDKTIEFDYEHNTGEYEPYKFCVPVEHDEGVRWVGVTITALAEKATTRSPAFNPWDKRDAYETDQEAKRKEKEINAKNKASKKVKKNVEVEGE